MEIPTKIVEESFEIQHIRQGLTIRLSSGTYQQPRSRSSNAFDIRLEKVKKFDMFRGLGHCFQLTSEGISNYEANQPDKQV